MTETCSERLIGTGPISRKALEQLASFDPAGLPDWFLKWLEWFKAMLQNMNDNYLAKSDMFGQEGDALRFPVARYCPPAPGDLALAGDWRGMDYDRMQIHVCYCDDRLQVFMFTGYAELTDVGPPEEYTWHPYVARIPLLSYPPNCCFVPKFYWYTNGTVPPGTYPGYEVKAPYSPLGWNVTTFPQTSAALAELAVCIYQTGHALMHLIGDLYSCWGLTDSYSTIDNGIG